MKKWNIYEIKTNETKIHGVMLRGRIRKFALENQIELLTENASDVENCVRFAVGVEQEPDTIVSFICKIIDDAVIEIVLESISNPVLSKLKVNNEERYSL